MQFGSGRGFWLCIDRTAWLAAGFLLALAAYSGATFGQSDEMATSQADQAILADPEASIIVGTRAAVGTDTVAEKAAEGVVGGVLGGILGRNDGARRSDRPDTIRDPTRKLDYAEIKAMNGGLETGARAQWGESGLLVSVRIDDAPGKGTFQSVFLQACDGRRFYPIHYEIYKLWPERSVAVGWSRATSVDGRVTDRESGSLANTWGDGVNAGPEGEGAGIWQSLGFDRAHHGARQLGAWFDIDPAEFAMLGELGLFVHTTLPRREPVTTAASLWLISPNDEGKPVLRAAEPHPDGWWGHCGGPPEVSPVGDIRFWAAFEIAAPEAKVMSQARSDDAEDVQFSDDENAAAPDEKTESTEEQEEKTGKEPACGSITGTVSTDPEKYFNAVGNIVVYVTGDCEFCPPKPEREDVVITQSEDGILPSFSVLPVGTTVEIVNGYEDEISFSTEFAPSPVDQAPGHIMDVLSKGERSEITPTRAGGYLVQSAWHRRIDAQMFVTPNECYAEADENGQYSIGKLPPGDYHLKVYTRRKRTNLPEADVTVKAGEVTARDFVLDRVVRKDVEQ